MRLFLLFFSGLFFSCLAASAQVPASRLEKLIRFTASDSVVLAYDERYFLLEDSCAAIVRHARFDPERRRFTGGFQDVVRTHPEQVVATGSYNDDGEREGAFTSYYRNGNLQAKGRFQDGRFQGQWELYYPSGQPKMRFTATDSTVQILDTWDENGRQLVNNGYGAYESKIGPIVWKGLLVGGQPDGKWIAQRFYKTGEELASEQFKLGVFQKGKTPSGEYREGSRILLVSAEDLLPAMQAEHFWVANQACGAAPAKAVIAAHYAKGPQAFAEEIKEHLAPVLGQLKLDGVNEPLELYGKVLTDGRVVVESTNKITAALKNGLLGLPVLEPAWVNGKRVEQEIVLVIRYNSSVYTFSYRLLPIVTE